MSPGRPLGSMHGHSPADSRDADDAGSHAVRFLPHERQVRVAAGQSVLEAGLGLGLNLPRSCRSGHCGACCARLIKGRTYYPNGPPLGLSARELADGFVLLCQARALSDLTVDVRLVERAQEAEIKTLPCRIEQLDHPAPEVARLWLRLPSVERLEFQAGQYLDVLIDGGRRRSYSIASPPHDAGLLELHVRRVRGGRFSTELFGAREQGSLLKIEGPFGRFRYHQAPGPALFIAGGTGFAPIKSMLRVALERGAPRALYLYWGARTAADLYDRALVERWVREHPQFHFQAVLSEPGPGAAARAGLVHSVALVDHPDLSGFTVYVAGPPGLIAAVRADYPARGLPESALHLDSFDYAVD
jgi:CDP-4-dehydro-6-deoxyglucose reductase, E3